MLQIINVSVSAYPNIQSFVIVSVVCAKYGGPLYVSENLGGSWQDYDLPGSPVMGYNMNSVFVDSGSIFVCHTTGLLQGHLE